METKNNETVDSVEKLEKAIGRVRTAQRIFATYTQSQVDKIFLAAASAANKARIPLAKLAVEEPVWEFRKIRLSKTTLLRIYIQYLQKHRDLWYTRRR